MGERERARRMDSGGAVVKQGETSAHRSRHAGEPRARLARQRIENVLDHKVGRVALITRGAGEIVGADQY